MLEAPVSAEFLPISYTIGNLWSRMSYTSNFLYNFLFSEEFQILMSI